MRKLLLAILLMGSGASFAQVGTFDRVFIRENFRPPLDTSIAPVRLGELRTRLQDSAVYVSISLTGRRWVKISGANGQVAADGNNYTTSMSFNAGTSILTLTRQGLDPLSTSIPIPVYNGSETKINSGTGGVTVTGLGTVASPYIISVPVYNGSETKVNAGYGLVISGNGTVATPYVPRIDTALMLTVLRGRSLVDSLGILVKTRTFVSKDTSVSLTLLTGAIRDTLDIRSLDSAYEVTFYSPDNTVIIETNENGDSISLRAPASGTTGGDNWGSQLAVVDNTMTGNGTALSALSVRRAWVDSIITLRNLGTVSSVGLTMPSGFTVLGSPITGSGSFSVTANGTASDYIRGNGTIAAFPTIPTYDGSETKLAAGTNTTITGAGTIASPYVINSSGGGGGSGTVTSVGLTMPSAFTVTSSPITTSGTLTVTANGTALDYIRGNGTLATFPAIPTYDGSETKLSAGANITVTGLGTTGSPYVISGSGGGGGGSVTSVGLQAPTGFTVTNSPITTSGNLILGTSLTGMIHGTGSGFASATVSSPLQFSGGTLSILASSSVQNGFLSATDWNTFNNKQQAIQFRDEGVNTGSSGGALAIDVTGSGASVSVVSGVATINVPGYVPDGNNFTTSTVMTDGTLTTTRSGTGSLTATFSTSVIPEGSRLYYTDARARAALSAGAGISYNSSTGQITNSAPDQTVTIAGTGAASVTGTYPNFTVNVPTSTGIFASKSTITPATNYSTAYVKNTTSFEVSDKVLKMGSASSDFERTITVNATLYVSQSNFTPGNWEFVGTVPAGFRPSGLIVFPISSQVPGTGNPATTPIRAIDGTTGITGGAIYGSASGYIDPDGSIHVRIGSVSSYAVLSGTNTVVIPIVVTYFINAGT